MKTFEWNWKTSDGLEIYSRAWAPERTPKAVVCLIHGLGEHIGRYTHVGAALSKAGYALLGFDLRGHGKSEGRRGHTPGYEALMDDVAMFLEQAEAKYPKLPRFLYGHSVGGNLVLNYALRRKPKLAGVIATAPWLRLAFEPSASKVLLGRMMNNILPGFTQASGLETAALARDPQVVQAYENDPLVHDKISARMFVSIHEAGLWALSHVARFPLPLLLMHGEADRILSAEAARQFAAAAGKKATLKIWEGWYHEVHNEPEQGEAFKVMVQWLDGQMKRK